MEKWTFAELEYSRPDEAKLRAEFQALNNRLKNAASYEEARAAFIDTQNTSVELQSMFSLAHIRQTLDTTDKFYNDELEFLHRFSAELIPLSREGIDALLESPFRPDFEKEFGKQLFTTAELERKLQNPAIIEDKIAESKLKEEYSILAASCKTEFKGATQNFYGLLKFMEDPDRETRRAAFVEWSKLYESISDKLDDMYDKLIEIRLRMAEKLGFNNYAEMAYANMGRTDYGAEQVASFREQVREVIVPAALRYREAQAKRIGIDKLKYYDENYMFPDGNADPVGGEDVLLPIGQRMYRELSPETAEFFDFMVEHNLFDLSTRPGKHLGGYCSGIQNKLAPFIFSNFNGTAADTGVLTHEAGHAFASYTASRCQPIRDYAHSTAEVAEIHSMTMEHFTYPWLRDMFGEQNAAKAKFTHLADAFCVVPYLVSVDEFQHKVFENPHMSHEERRLLWSDIEKKYLPWRDYDGDEFLSGGGFWMQKQHVFLYPFYYIDYALAQTCAFELYGRMKENPKQAWEDYLNLVKAGGSTNYFNLLKIANLSNPFESGSVARAVGHVVEELDELSKQF
ncbi:MAG: M3 family oligoendopeptidase [Oscillospiraceae bacterium]|jgi:M3 family oligoendopeptidase|nr:M3 family oligoendopeptidase [Oscillospiraceae bacterium]